MTRPDTTSAVPQFARFCDNSERAHWTALVKILQHLLQTKGKRLIYGRSLDGGFGISVFVDADHPPACTACALFNGGTLSLGGCYLLFFKDKAVTAVSTLEPKYVATAEVVKKNYVLAAGATLHHAEKGKAFYENQRGQQRRDPAINSKQPHQ